MRAWVGVAAVVGLLLTAVGMLEVPAATAAPAVYPIDSTDFVAGLVCVTSTDCEGYGSNSLIPFDNGANSGYEPIPGMLAIHDLTCPISSTCFAVGQSTTDNTANPPSNATSAVVEIQYGVVYPPTVIADVSDLDSIACYPGTTTCVAVGRNEFSTSVAPYYYGVVVPLADGQPSGPVQEVPTFFQIPSVACPSAANCVAVGLAVEPNLDDYQALLPITGGEAGSPVAQGTFSGEPSDVFCASASVCYVVGGTNVQQIVSGVPGTTTTVTGVTSLDSGTCLGTSQCWLAGNSSNTGAIVPMTSGAPGSAQLMGGTTNLSGIACVKGPECVAAGNEGSGGNGIGVFVLSVVSPPPTISSVAVTGSGTAVKVTVTGKNFGSLSPGPNPASSLSCVPKDTSFDYLAGVLGVTDTTQGWSAGTPGSCVGLVIESWSATRIVMGLGAGYVYPHIAPGDQMTVTVEGATASATAAVTATAPPAITTVSVSGSGTSTRVTVTGSGLGSRVPVPSPLTPVSCTAGDTSYTYGDSALWVADTTQGWTAGQPGDCLGLSVVSWSNTKIVLKFGAFYASVPPATVGDSLQVGVLGATYSGTVGEGPPPTIDSVTFSGSGSALTVSVTGSGFGSSPPTPDPTTPLSCVPGDTSYDYPAGVLSFDDNTQGWGAGVDGDCIGIALESWTTQGFTFTFGADYPNFPPVDPGDTFQLQVNGVTFNGTAD